MVCYLLFLVLIFCFRVYLIYDLDCGLVVWFDCVLNLHVVCYWFVSVLFLAPYLIVWILCLSLYCLLWNCLMCWVVFVVLWFVLVVISIAIWFT